MYAIITKNYITIPGDERSRTNPGHGYFEHDVENISWYEFETEEQLLAYVKSHSSYGYKPFKVIKFEELNLRTEVKIVRPD